MRGVDTSTLPSRPTLPFLAVCCLAFAVTPLDTSNTDWLLVIVAEVLALWIAGAAWIIPWERLASPWLLLLPIACDSIIMILRQAHGGAQSGYGILTLLPVVWVGLTLGRRSVLAISFCTAVVFAAPIAFFGAPDYPSTGWRGALLITVVALVTGLVTNHVIGEQHRQTRLAGERHRTLKGMFRTQSVIGATTDDLDAVLRTIASDARELVRAEAAVVELPEGRDLVFRAVSGSAELFAGHRVPRGGSVADECLRRMEALVIDDTELDARVDAAVCRHLRARSLAVVPLVDNGRAVGVLEVYARSPGSITDDDAHALSLLANLAGPALVRAELMGQLAEQATTDVLTGLPGRRAWDRELALAVARAARSQEPLTVVVLDVDGLKTINDREGHAAGDLLLRALASQWSSATRGGEMLARLGGDEFGLLLEGADAMAASGAVERLAASMPHGHTASAGIAEWDGFEGASSLLARADANMHAHKRARAAVFA